MKQSRFSHNVRPFASSSQKGNRVYLVPCQDDDGEMVYHFMIMTPQGQWMLNNLQTAHGELVQAFGRILASHEGSHPIQNLKRQLEESSLSAN